MSGSVRRATHARHYREPPQRTDADGSRHWITRAANFVVVISDMKVGARLARENTPDESLLLLPEHTQATVHAGGDTIIATSESLTILPPGASEIEVTKPGIVARVFSNKATDLMREAANAATYADGAPEVAPIEPWPDPIGGFKLRHYPFAKVTSPDPNPLKMRVYRSTNLMINIFEPWTKRRDPRKLSPHSHDDFEQVSLALRGAFVHHLRYPWTADQSAWRSDEHEAYESPSVLVIPARVIHTTQDVGDGTTWLIDIFGPPRRDFSSKPGFVLNAHDYPMPA
jgi:hypothetical protein